MVGFIRIGDGKYSTKIVKVKGVFMAIYGIGAFYGGGIGNVTESFLLRNSACVGWEESDAPSLYQLIKYIKVGDIIYIKSKTPQKGLTIKAVGIVFDDQISYRDLCKTSVQRHLYRLLYQNPFQNHLSTIFYLIYSLITSIPTYFPTISRELTLLPLSI